MIRTLFFLVKLGLAVAVAVWLAQRPGQVTIVWQGYEVTLSVAVLLLGVGAIAILTTALYGLWRALVTIPQSFALGHLSRRQRKGYLALTQGLVAVAAGDAGAARRFAHKADKLLNQPALTLLLQAQAAQLNGDDAEAAKHYGQMMMRPETSGVGLRGLLTQTVARGDTAQALALARRAALIQPKAAWVLTSLVDLEARSGHWEAALAALTTATRQNAFSPDQARRLRATFLVGQSQACGTKEDALRFAKKAHDAFPAWSPPAAHYATLLIQNGQGKLAGKVIERTWRADPHPELARLYAEAGGAGLAPAVQLRRMERLASFNPEAVESRLALARAALDAQLWGVARAQLAAAQAKGETAPICRLMATLEEKESANHRLAQDWLRRAADAPPDKTWHCDSCGTTAPAWSPLCSLCGAPGLLAWRGPSTLHGHFTLEGALRL